MVVEAGSWIEYLSHLSGLHVCSAFHDRDQILQYFFSLTYSFIPVHSFFVICPVYATLLALERCIFFHFAFYVATRIWGATTKIRTDVETELIQQLFIEPYMPRTLSK